MEDVCRAVAEAPNLRQAISLAAALFAELLEWGIEHRAWDPAWRADLSGLCIALGEPLDDPPDDWIREDAELDEWAWATAAHVLGLYDRLNTLDEWDLYAEACLGQETSDRIGDRESLVRWGYSAAVAYVHGYVARAGDAADA